MSYEERKIFVEVVEEKLSAQSGKKQQQLL